MNEQVKEMLKQKADYEKEVLTKYYILEKDGSCWLTSAYDRRTVMLCAKRGLLFKTEEQARKYDAKRRLNWDMENWANIYNDGWQPNWCNIHQDKYCIEITPSTGHFYIARRHAINHIGLLPCLKSEELAGAFIKEFGERIKELLIDDCTKSKDRREE